MTGPGATLSVPRLTRLAGGAREVVASITGAAHHRRALKGQLDYITRRGELALEDQDGFRLRGRSAIKDLLDDWLAMARADSRQAANAPLSRALVFSMPPGSDPQAVAAASRAAAHERFGGRFDFVWVRHDDTAHPHVHMIVRAQGRHCARFTPDRTDLRHLREAFAAALRQRGVQAEATPRWLRGVTRKSERPALRKMREQFERGEGPPPRTLQAAYLEAAEAAFGAGGPLRPWEVRIAERQGQVRGFYRQQAKLLESAADPQVRRLGVSLMGFVQAMPEPDTRRLALARELRALNQVLLDRDGPVRERSR